jgi:hypothetical protein
MPLMEIARLLRDYFAVLAWPIVALIAILKYRKVVKKLVPGSRVKFTLAGFSIETTIPVIEKSVTESLGGKPLSRDQIALLEMLRTGRRTFDKKSEEDLARSLRNAGLLKSYPEECQLADAKEIELTTLGKLVIEAAKNQFKIQAGDAAA